MASRQGRPIESDVEWVHVACVYDPKVEVEVHDQIDAQIKWTSSWKSVLGNLIQMHEHICNPIPQVDISNKMAWKHVQGVLKSSSW